MNPFLPPLYPDETFHSVIARYHMRSGNLKYSYTYKDLFAVNLRKVNITLPSHINKLFNQISNEEITPDQLIENHTLYSFLVAFKPEDRKIIKDYMINGNTLELNKLNTFNKGNIKVNNQFQHCYECLERDIQIYGETYWHRIHQLSGVYICPIHKKPLIRVKKQIMDNIENNFILANQKEIFEYPYSTLAKDRNLNLLYIYAKEAAYCIENYKYLREIRDLPLYYRNALKIKGFAKGNYINRKLIYSEMKKYYGDAFLNLMGSPLENSDNNWIFKLFNNKLFSHTLRHILFIIFLFGGTAQFIEFIKKSSDSKTESSMFGSGPWPCLNPAHSEYLKNTISTVKIKRSNHGHLLGIFECTCGFVYSKRAEKDNNSSEIITKIKFGPTWEAKLKDLINQGMSQRSIAKQLQVVHSTIKKYSDILEDESHNKNIFFEVLQNKRKQWLKLIKENENISAKTNYSLYQWLNKNDKDWLKVNFPKNELKKQMKSKNRIDWGKRDLDILNEVKYIVENWGKLEKDRPLKRTKSSIAKQTKSSINIILHNNHHRIPKTLNYIKSVVEDSYKYNLRKIEWAYNELITESRYSITIQDLVDKAGLSKNGWHLTKEFYLNVVVKKH